MLSSDICTKHYRYNHILSVCTFYQFVLGGAYRKERGGLLWGIKD